MSQVVTLSDFRKMSVSDRVQSIYTHYRRSICTHYVRATGWPVQSQSGQRTLRRKGERESRIPMDLLEMAWKTLS